MPKIQVIGESCLDIFVYCDANRLAPDLPVPVLIENRVATNPGMAANVYRNILAHVNDCLLVTNNNWDTITKRRYVHEESNHLFLRVDTPQEVETLEVSSLDFDSEILVISDYNKGFLTESVIEEICNRHEQVFLDTKKVLGTWADKAAFIKINDYEYKRSTPFITKSISDKLIHTRGSSGCDFRGVNYPVEQISVRDTSGAGDSFMAALVIEYLKTADIIASIKGANNAASKVVRTRGVGVI
ncbi:MAG: Synechococcus phage [Actinomycetota bacterium]|jgi:bifunctional ADP-heptose synthase (sugar kinase/adenylyltransferase)